MMGENFEDVVMLFSYLFETSFFCFSAVFRSPIFVRLCVYVSVPHFFLQKTDLRSKIQLGADFSDFAYTWGNLSEPYMNVTVSYVFPGGERIREIT